MDNKAAVQVDPSQAEASPSLLLKHSGRLENHHTLSNHSHSPSRLPATATPAPPLWPPTISIRMITTTTGTRAQQSHTTPNTQTTPPSTSIPSIPMPRQCLSCLILNQWSIIRPCNHLNHSTEVHTTEQAASLAGTPLRGTSL